MGSTPWKNVTIGYALVLATLVVNGAITARNVRMIVEKDRWERHTHEVLTELANALNALLDAETGQRGYLLTGDPAYLGPYHTGSVNIMRSIDRLGGLVSDNPRQQDRVVELRRLVIPKIELLRRAVALREEKGLDAALAFVRTNRGKRAMDQARLVIGAMTREEDRLLADRRESARAAVRMTVLSFAIGTALTLALLLMLYRLKRREDVERERAADALRRSEAWFHTTLRSIGEAVIATDHRGRVRVINPVAEALTGWSTAEAEGRPLVEVFRIANEETGATVESPVAKVLAEGVVVGLANHTVLIAKDGKVSPIDDSAAPILDDNGQVVGVVLTFRDVTERRRSERELRESEARKAAILESALDAIITIDHQGMVVEFNPAAERTFGHPRADVLGRELAGLIIPEPYREAHRRGLGHYLETGAGRVLGKRIEITALRAGGDEFPVELAVTAIRTDGKPLFTAYLRDISERKRAEEELAEASRKKDEFLALMAHELRNPLAPLRTALHLLKRADQDGVDQDWAREMMERQVGRLTRLVDDLMDIARITRGRLELRKDVVELSSVLARAVEDSRPIIEGRNHELTVAIPPEPIRLEADPARLEQVLDNLLINAAKFMDPGGRIWLGAERDGGDVVIRVRDTGVGVTAEMLPRIFGQFVQAERRLEHSQGGLGIGLSLVKTLVEMHGGSVSATSPGLGQGSEFVVRLPALAGAAQGSVPAVPSAKVDREDRPYRRRILVVDDNEAAADGLGRLLKRLFGQEVRVAYDGPSALDLAASFQPEAVLLDIGMPGMDGYEVARRLKRRPEFAETLIVAVTGWGQDEDRRRSKEAGIDLHLVKPVDPQLLGKLISKPKSSP